MLAAYLTPSSTGSAALMWRLPVFFAAVERPATSVENSRMDDSADRTDIAATLGGDAEAYRRIVQRYQSSIARRMRRLTPDITQTEELVQDVFVEAYFSLRKYSGRAPFEHWLNKIATRVGYAYLKKRRGNEKWIESSGNSEPIAINAGEALEATDTLDQVMSRLSPRDRLVLTLLHLEERTVAETARLTGWSRVLVKVQAHRARARLRKLVEKIQ
jgi:RNA polymerase sigma-70 factor (ECF subfamily)